MLKIKVDSKHAAAHLNALAKKQLPFALKTALNQTAKKVIEAEKREMQTAFDKPRAYTLNSLFIRKWASKTDLTAVVDFKDGKGRSAGKYLTAQIQGGSRKSKAVENMLAGKGLMPPGWRILPAAIKLDGSGNITIATFRSLLRGIESGTHFALLKQCGKLEPGLYRRSKRGGIKPLLIYISGAAYAKRFKYFETAERAVRAEYRPLFDKALAHAISTAR